MTVQALLAELMTEFEAEARWLGLVAHLIINGSNDQMSWLGLHQAHGPAMDSKVFVPTDQALQFGYARCGELAHASVSAA
jgi:hypothetical protein